MKKSQVKLLRTLKEIPEVRRKNLSILRLAMRTELSEKTIRNNLQELADQGAIQLTRPHAGVPYSIVINPTQDDPEERAA